MAHSRVVTAKRPAKRDKYKVGDLVYASHKALIYMLVQRDNTLPYRAGSGTLAGVCVWSRGGTDRDGDTLPQVGYYHDNLGENRLELFKSAVVIQNDDTH